MLKKEKIITIEGKIKSSRKCTDELNIYFISFNNQPIHVEGNKLIFSMPFTEDIFKELNNTLDITQFKSIKIKI